MITGTGLGSGFDITSVILADVPVLRIINQTADSVLVTSGAYLGGPALGSVIVNSTSVGVSTMVNGFGYFSRTQ